MLKKVEEVWIKNQYKAMHSLTQANNLYIPAKTQAN